MYLGDARNGQITNADRVNSGISNEGNMFNVSMIKLNHMFNAEVKGFNGYIELAKKTTHDELKEHFMTLAQTELNEAEQVHEIALMVCEQDSGTRSHGAIKDSMARELETMETKLEKTIKEMEM